MTRSTTCALPDCDAPWYCRDWCRPHYRQWRRTGNPEAPPAKRRFKTPPGCAAEGCERQHYARDYCKGHYMQWRRGSELHAIGPQRRGPEHLPRSAGARQKGRYMVVPVGNGDWDWEHRMVMREKLGRDLLPGENVHHINGNKVDNRPENLELWRVGQPAGQRLVDQLAWARELLATYDGKSVG